MQFIDREQELALVRDHLGRPGAGLFVLYGRRRIGKTALLEEALRSVPRAAYHVGTRSTIAEELSRLSRSELYQRAAAARIEGRSRMSKAELVAALRHAS